MERADGSGGSTVERISTRTTVSFASSPCVSPYPASVNDAETATSPSAPLASTPLHSNVAE